MAVEETRCHLVVVVLILVLNMLNGYNPTIWQMKDAGFLAEAATYISYSKYQQESLWITELKAFSFYFFLFYFFVNFFLIVCMCVCVCVITCLLHGISLCFFFCINKNIMYEMIDGLKFLIKVR